MARLVPPLRGTLVSVLHAYQAQTSFANPAIRWGLLFVKGYSFITLDDSMSVPQVIFKKEMHRQKLVLSIYTPNAEPFNSIVRKLGCTYSVTKKTWWLPFEKQVVNTAYVAFKGKAWVDYSAVEAHRETSTSLSLRQGPKPYVERSRNAQRKQTVWTQAQKDAMWAFAQKMELRRMSPSTYRTYGVYFKQFLAAHPNIRPEEITEDQIKKHIVSIVKKHNYATKTQNQIVNALKPVGFLR